MTRPQAARHSTPDVARHPDPAPDPDPAATAGIAGAAGPQPRRRGGLRDVAMTVLVPALIMSTLSRESRLGPELALIVALIFPISHGVSRLVQERRVEWLAVLGIVSVLLTGGFALLKLPRDYIVWKETGVPAVIGLTLLCFQLSGRPLVRWFLAQILDLDAIARAYGWAGRQHQLRRDLAVVDYGYLASFLLSAILNYLLAVTLLVSDPVTQPEAFTAELGQMTALSFPVIALPTGLISLGLLVFFALRVHRVTGRSFENYLVVAPQAVAPSPARAPCRHRAEGGLCPLCRGGLGYRPRPLPRGLEGRTQRLFTRLGLEAPPPPSVAPGPRRLEPRQRRGCSGHLACSRRGRAVHLLGPLTRRPRDPARPGRLGRRRPRHSHGQR